MDFRDRFSTIVYLLYSMKARNIGRIKEMARLTFNSNVSGNEVNLLLRALNIFVQTDNPVVIFSNGELTKLFGDAEGGDIYTVVKDFSTKAISEIIVFEEPADKSFKIYPLVEEIGWKEGALLVRFDLSAEHLVDEWRKYYLSNIYRLEL